MSDPVLNDFAARLSNAKIAQALEFIAPRLHSELTLAIMREAARRLRGEPEPHFAVPAPPDLPPLEAHGVPDADSAPIGLLIDQIAYEAIQKVR